MRSSEPTVGVRAFRARLSAYLRAVAEGRSFTVRDRHQPVARLIPVSRSSEHETLDKLATRGVIQRGVGKPGRSRRVKAARGSRLVSELVAEDRG
jgi:antitoxin (DNA-binding transcriptional repressor) of toxin-antitoxin stability system